MLINLVGLLQIVCCSYTLITTYSGITFHHSLPWVHLSQDSVLYIGIYVDFLAALMLFMITLISWVVHIYSLAYIQDNIKQQPYFILLNLSVSAACWVVVSDNLWEMLIGWELIGLASSLLIAFWYQQPTAAKASLQAWITSKLGSICLLIGIVVVVKELGNCNLMMLVNRPINATANFSNSLFIAGICFLIAAFTKSAQFPFFNWLPNAMKAPTPASALLHAATVLSIGIYLLIRIETILLPECQNIMITIGYTTACMGACAALLQQHIKRMLAYSTLSQLGYVIAAIGLKTLGAGITYLLLHGLAKACLFLCAGIVIKFLQHQGTKEENAAYMDQLGGIRHYLPWVAVSYLVATITLVGLPGLTGFHAKEAILEQTLLWSIENVSIDNYYIAYIVPVMAFTSTFLTALYLGKSFLLIFFGTPTWRNDIKVPIVKNNYLKSMQGSVLALSIFVVGFSILPIQQFIIDGLAKANIAYVLDSLSMNKLSYIHFLTMSLAIGVLFSSILLLAFLFIKPKRIIRISKSNKITQLFSEGWYMDALVSLFAKQILSFSKHTVKVEKYMIDGFIKRLANSCITTAYSVAWLENKLIAGFIRYLTIGYVIIAHIVAWIDNKLIDGIGRAIATIFGSFSKLYLHIQKGNTQHHIAWSFISILLLLIAWIIYNSLFI
ncbi:NADH-quinone oxidoreductase subunit 5 family protein [Candidatus Amoebophilus asiaticus]|uniref:NADH-quinone oxidoreductase subunit 5 family protein n=1 Tax=Candidatus Amoebophilus asiaticus TaxID=281120 RepID=UPI00032225A7|nr:NADH-quinone oxidoreductase subunit L [Candidatus Amoebophilus asiaticus]